jgi:hypothetical protein
MWKLSTSEDQTAWSLIQVKLIEVDRVSQTAAGRGDVFGIGSGACSPQGGTSFATLAPLRAGLFFGDSEGCESRDLSSDSQRRSPLGDGATPTAVARESSHFGRTDCGLLCLVTELFAQSGDRVNDLLNQVGIGILFNVGE